MTREIKFRAWDKANKQMIYSSQCGIAGGDYGLPSGSLSVFFNIFDDGICELMQYTGLKDKNGKEIYEGDIVRIWANSQDYGGYKGHNYIGAVEWEEFSLGFILSNGIGLRDFEFIEILGNIYENPDLCCEVINGHKTN